MFSLRTIASGGALAAAALALVVPTAGAGGSTHNTFTFSEPTDWFGPDECSGTTITGQGTGTESGTIYETDTPNGGVHVIIDAQGSADLYEANGPGPWDPQPGRYIGHWDYRSSTSDQAPPNQAGSTTGRAAGVLTFPDGSTARRQLVYHITWEPNGGGVKIFFVKFVCASNN